MSLMFVHFSTSTIIGMILARYAQVFDFALVDHHHHVLALHCVVVL
jgi:hypothetical protein